MFYSQDDFRQDEGELWTTEEAMEALSQIRTLFNDYELIRFQKETGQHRQVSRPLTDVILRSSDWKFTSKLEFQSGISGMG